MHQENTVILNDWNYVYLTTVHSGRGVYFLNPRPL